jgi:hypothetical protein
MRIDLLHLPMDVGKGDSIMDIRLTDTIEYDTAIATEMAVQMVLFHTQRL